MPKTKTPPLADWLVRFTDTSHRTVRATSLHIREGSYVLSDTYGHPLFAAPLGAVLCVRRLEPGEEVPAPLSAAGKLGAAGLVTHMAEAHDQHFTVGFSHEEIVRAHNGAHATAPDSPAGPIPPDLITQPEPGAPAAAEKPVPPQRSRSAKRGR